MARQGQEWVNASEHAREIATRQLNTCVLCGMVQLQKTA